MIDHSQLASVCGDPMKNDAKLLWVIDFDAHDRSYECVIKSAESGYIIHMEAHATIEVVRHATPFANLQAAVESVHAHFPSGLYSIRRQGVSLEQYQRMCGRGYVTQILPGPDSSEPPRREGKRGSAHYPPRLV